MNLASQTSYMYVLSHGVRPQQIRQTGGSEHLYIFESCPSIELK